MRLVLFAIAITGFAVAAAQQTACGAPKSAYVDLFAAAEFEVDRTAAERVCPAGATLSFASDCPSTVSVDAVTGRAVFSGSQDASCRITINCAGMTACTQELAFAVVRPLTLPSASTTSAPEPSSMRRCREAYGFNVVVGQEFSADLSVVEFADTCSSAVAGRYTFSSNNQLLTSSETGTFTARAGIEGISTIPFTLFCGSEQYCEGSIWLQASTEQMTPAPTRCRRSIVLQVSNLGHARLPDACTFGPGFPPGVEVEGQIATFTMTTRPVNWSFAVVGNCSGIPCDVSMEATVPARAVTPAPTTLPPLTSRTTCSGSCMNDAAVLSPFSPQSSDGASNSEQDTVSAVVGSKEVTIVAPGKISNMGARFPAFSIVSSSSRLVQTTVQRELVPFDATCLDQQAPYGVGEQVWTWTNVTELRGMPARAYASGESYYQKFGGKHDNCDTFNNGCKFAPLLSPGSHWRLNVSGCSTQWTGTFNLTELLNLKKQSFEPVFVISADGQGRAALSGSVYNQLVRPVSWVQPSLGVESQATVSSLRFTVQPVTDATTRGATWIHVGGSARTWEGEGRTSVTLSAILFPRRAVDSVVSVQLVRVQWSDVSANTCESANASIMESCLAKMPVSPSFGPASVRPCLTSKPFSPLGVDGLSDTSCDATSITSRSLNLTVQVPMSLDAMRMPSGEITVRLSSVVDGAVVFDDVTLSLSYGFVSRPADNDLSGVSVHRCTGFPLNPFETSLVADCTESEGFFGPQDIARVSVAGCSTAPTVSYDVDGRLTSLETKAFANAQRVGTNELFVPASLCTEPSAPCHLKLSVTCTEDRAPEVISLLVDPRIASAISGNTTKASFLSTAVREDGAELRAVDGAAEHAALSVAIFLFGAVLVIGALTVYTSDGAQAVVKEHGQVMSHYVKKVTGIQLAASSSTSKPAKPAQKSTGAPSNRSVPKSVAVGR